MKKRIICGILAAVMALSLCACGVGGGRYRVVKKIADQEYSIGFRSGDSSCYYVEAALKELSYDGVIDDLAREWFGDDDAVDFPKKKNAIQKAGYIEPRNFIIGVDLNSYPMCYKLGNDYTGFDVELAGKVCEKLGWTLKVQPIRSEDAYIELNSGNIDCAWGGVVLDTESPDYFVLLTYMSNELVIAAKGATGGVLRGKTLYMSSSQSYLDIINEKAHLVKNLEQITRVDGSAGDFFEYLDKGECDYILTTSSAVRFYNHNK